MWIENMNLIFEGIPFLVYLKLTHALLNRGTRYSLFLADWLQA